MKALSLVIGAAVAALATTGASAQSANLTGTYRCIQMCRDGMIGAPAYITQNGSNFNLVTETGEFSAPGPTGRRLQAGSGSTRATRARSIRPTASASSSTTAASGSATSAPRRSWSGGGKPAE